MDLRAQHELLPVLVCDLADDEARDILEGVALAEQVAYLPLLAAPVDRSVHALEVYAPNATEPLRLFAEPVGPPTADGFPLRLRFAYPASSTGLRAQEPKPLGRPPTLRGRHVTTHELSDRHTADLEGESGERRSPVELVLVGRELAGGKLRIESLIGAGGAGAVYKAQHRSLRIPVAVKVLHDTHQADADYGRRFHAEALAASRLDHPNVTRVLDFGQEPDGLLYLAMEYLDGVGLRSILDDVGRLPLPRLVKLGSQICAGLAHAHARSIVHKDVKPENLVILRGADDDGNAMEIVKVCDFGIAQGAVEEKAKRFQGTPEYMSPEQCVQKDLDARSDVYSTGIVLYELATGALPFEAERVEHLMFMQIHHEPEPPSKRAPDVDPRLEKVILRALAKNPDERYGTMRDLRAALRSLLEKPPPSLSGQHKRFDPRLVVAPAPAPAPAPGWLIPSVSQTNLGAVSVPSLELGTSDPLGATLRSDPSAFMRKLVQTTDPRAFAELAAPLESIIRDLARDKDAEVLWRLASTLDVLATDGPETPGSRAAISVGLLRVLRDPSTLGPIAQQVLSSEDAAGVRLVAAAGAFGAHALYSARVRQSDADARARFRRALETVGAAALPILRSGLERLADRLGAPGAPAIAEDLLVVVRQVRRADDALGAIVARYARATLPELAAPAVASLPALWGERSRALVLGLVAHEDERVLGATLLALSELGFSDERTARHVARAFDASRAPVKMAAAQALSSAKGDAKTLARIFVADRVRDLLKSSGADLQLGDVLARVLAHLSEPTTPTPARAQ